MPSWKAAAGGRGEEGGGVESPGAVGGVGGAGAGVGSGVVDSEPREGAAESAVGVGELGAEGEDVGEVGEGVRGVDAAGDAGLTATL